MDGVIIREEGLESGGELGHAVGDASSDDIKVGAVDLDGPVT